MDQIGFHAALLQSNTPLMSHSCIYVIVVETQGRFAHIGLKQKEYIVQHPGQHARYKGRGLLEHDTAEEDDQKIQAHGTLQPKP